MVLLREWCCFRDLRHVAIAAGMFSMVTSFTQIIAEIVYWWQGEKEHDFNILDNQLQKSFHLNSSGGSPAVDPTVTLATYIVMTILDGLMIIFALILMVGVSKAPGGRCLVLLWVIYLPIYMAYEAGFNVYQYVLYSQAYGARKLFSSPVVLVLIYWCLKVIFNLALLIGTIAYVQLLKEHMFRAPQVNASDQPSYPSGGGSNHGEQDKQVYKIVSGPPNYRTHDTRQPVAYAVYPGPKGYRAY